MNNCVKPMWQNRLIIDNNEIMKIEIVKDIKGIIINAEVVHEDYCGICNVEMVHAFDWYDRHWYRVLRTFCEHLFACID